MNRKTQTVADVQETLRLIKKQDARNAMARAMLNHGNLAKEAREFVINWIARQ